MVENRRVGIKSREIYECPGALALLHGPRRPRGPDPGAGPGPREGPARAPLGRAGLRRPVVLAAQSWPSTPSLPRRQRYVTGEVPLALRAPGGAASGSAPVSSSAAKPGRLYDYALATYDGRRPVPAPGRRRIRAPLGPRRRDLGRQAGQPANSGIAAAGPARQGAGLPARGVPGQRAKQIG